VARRAELTSREREFFASLSRAAFANPFSELRVTLDRQLAGCSPGATERQCRERMVARARDEIARLQDAGKADLRRHDGEDRVVLASAFLFEIFHQFSGEFDALILAQAREKEESVPVPFADAILGRFDARGFRRDEGLRYLALLFQLQRAYFFIDAGLVGRSRSMRELRRHLWDNVFSRDILLYDRHLWNRMEDFSTLILGETGTGKGTAAAAIGQSGFIPFDPGRGRFAESFTRVFLPVNLAQLPESLIESELFGHRRGAFTGAVDSHRGILARCSARGSIFLDEIGDAPPAVQVKLLQVLQERTFVPVGDHERQRFEGRVIAATNRALAELRRSGAFRDDFYYRLCSDCIEVPTLRQRLAEDPAELGLILEAIVARMAGDAAGDLVGGIREAIEQSPGRGHPWPGNVRELEQAVRRILLTGSYLPERAGPPAGGLERLLDGVASGLLTADELLDAYCAQLYRVHGTYEEAGRLAGLDRRTVRKRVERGRRSLRL
jgi:DNA-binding NtrC family response regulator